MTCIILVSGNNVISSTTAVRCRRSHEGVPFNMVHFKHCSYLNKLVTRWQKENMSTSQKIPVHVVLYSPLSISLVVILVPLSRVCDWKSPQVTNPHVLYNGSCKIHDLPLRKVLNERRNSQVWEVEEVNAASYILHTGMKRVLPFSFIHS